MKKAFTAVIPDAPYSGIVTQNRTVNCMYNGYRYHVLAVNKVSKNIEYISGSYTTLDEINMSQHKEDDPNIYFVTLDANENPWEAAYLTEEYTHDPVDDYVEALPNGTEYRYVYSQDNVVTEVYNHLQLKYENGQYIKPSYRTHMVSKESYWAGVDEHIAAVESELADHSDEYLPEDVTVLQEALQGMKDLKIQMADVDHWKIDWPWILPDRNI